MTALADRHPLTGSGRGRGSARLDTSRSERAQSRAELAARRLAVGHCESDEEGCLDASEEPGADGAAKGFDLSLYVPDPFLHLPERFSTPDNERKLEPWLRERYPRQLFFCFDTDEHFTATAGTDYADGEDHEAAHDRLMRESDYLSIRNEGCTFYTLAQAFAEHLGAGEHFTVERRSPYA